MAILDEIEVSIISDDRALVEYSDPDREDQNDVLTAEKYIGASTGSKFAVRYTVKPTFRLYHAQGVHISIYADGQYATGRNVSESRLRHREWTETITTMTYYCHDRDIWMDAKMAFGDIQIVEGASDKISSRSAKDLGTLTVEFRRVVKRSHTSPQLTDLKNAIGAEVSEKSLKGRAITNRVMGVDGSARAGPLPPSEYTAINGEYGQPFSFKFHYRSRSALQILGCIPRSPSPALLEQSEPVSVATRIADERETQQDPKTLSKDEEIQRLRARLAELGEETRVKKEGGGKARQLSGGLAIKRERTGRESSPRKRVKTIEVVDLTED
ncbi:MAG: hypothetical protein M1840_008212 [Geoglossum simile]|nr:MAG: hypothetical protein M1840_008212 [Geoglossum simile]